MPFFCLLDLTKVLYKLHDPEKTSETVRKREDKQVPVVFWCLLPSLHATWNCILVCYCLGFSCQWAGIYLPYSCATRCNTVEEAGKDHGFYLHSFGSLHEKSPLLHCIEWNRKLQTWVMKHQVWETMGKKTHLSTSVGNTSHEIDDAETTWNLCILLQRSHNYSIAHGLNSHQFIANIKFQHLLYANYHKQKWIYRFSL